MSEPSFWTFSYSYAPTHIIIPGLIISNLILIWLAVAQKRRHTKSINNIPSAQTLSSSVKLASESTLMEYSRPEKEVQDTSSHDISSLKIDNAIKMLKAGHSLEEIIIKLDIEASYLQIIAKHHHG